MYLNIFTMDKYQNVCVFIPCMVYFHFHVSDLSVDVKDIREKFIFEHMY